MEAQPLGGARLYSAKESVWLVAYWTLAWVVVHHVAWPLWRCWLWLTGAARGRPPPGPLEKYRRRLCRSQVYCALAVAGGAHLLSRCRWHPHDLLYEISMEHQVLFGMAVGHWATALWEDFGSTSFLRAGLSNSGDMDLGKGIWAAYLVHHVVAGAAFALVLWLHSCTGIAMFGLVFELPVLLMNHREFATFADKPPAWFQDQRRVEDFWNRLDVLFKVGRYGPTAVYIYSICFWWSDLEQLNDQESALYHGMAIFFSALNWVMHGTLLNWWRTRDIKSTKPPDADALEEAALKAQEEEEELQELGKSQHNPHAATCVSVAMSSALTPIDEDDFKASMGPDNPQGKVFLEIDSIAYEVSEFLAKHPGGSAVLVDYSGRDASEAFHQARHSMNAKIQMQKYCIGPIKKAQKAYRIYEHPEAMGRVWSEGFRMTLAFVPAAVLLPRTILGDFAEAANSPKATLGEMLAPGLVLSMWAGWFFLMVLFATLQLQIRLTRGVLKIGGGLGMMLCGFALARLPLPAGLPLAAPTGLELGIVLVLLFEDVAELSARGSRHWRPWHSLGAFAVIGVGLLFRGLPELVWASRAPGLAALLFASGLCLMVRQIDDDRCSQEIKADTLHGIAFLGPAAGTAMIYLYSTNPAVAAIVQEELAGTSWFWIGGSLQVISASVLLGTVLMTNSTYVCSPAWSTRAIALIFAMGVGPAGGIFNWRWLSWLAWLLHTRALGDRQEIRIDAAGMAGKFGEVPDYQVGTRALWDLLRTGIGTWFWMLMLKPVRSLVNFIMPEELTMYGSPIPIFDLGEDVDLGVAAYFAPEAVLKSNRPESQLPPEYFVCNVGHVDTRAAGGMLDLQKTMNTLRDTWTEFRQPDMQGLVANIVCFFPRVKGTTFAKELNLSCWHSAEDAQEWYAKSPAHGDIMRQHGNGELRTFGNLLASLVPHGKIRHQDRCSACARLVESDRVGEKAPRRCRACGGRGFGYPWF